mmetsp:Transcript_22936/g.39022  ORF Transcript_22936/g.39022 Transcript_22936/m.39022 type:complete len:133 (+) Transcript_22936:37-435(+)
MITLIVLLLILLVNVVNSQTTTDTSGHVFVGTATQSANPTPAPTPVKTLPPTATSFVFGTTQPKWAPTTWNPHTPAWDPITTAEYIYDYPYDSYKHRQDNLDYSWQVCAITFFTLFFLFLFTGNCCFLLIWK